MTMSPNYIFSQCKQAISSAVIGPRRFLHPLSFLVYPPSLRATMTIYIVTGGAVLYSPFTSSGQISQANISARERYFARGTRRNRGSRARIRSSTTLEIAPRDARLSSKNLHVRDRPILASGQVSVPVTCVTRPAERLFTYGDGGGAAVEGGGGL